MANPAVVVLRGSSTTAPHVRGTHEEVDAPQTAPLLQRSLDNEDSVYHENRISFVGFLRISAARIKTWMLQTNAQQCTSLFLVLVLSSTVTSLATYAIQDQISVWLAVMLSASVVVCFVRDGRTLSLRSTLLLGGALLLVAAPLLSAPVLVLLAAMMVLPLQWLIHRHRQDVTLEMVKEPPLARVKAMDVHPSQDVLALAYYTGHLVIWNVRSGIATSAMILSAQQPLRSVRFLNHPNDQCLLVAAGDDGSLVLVDGTTLRTLANVPAHSDFVRSVDVHPTRPFLLSCSDDRTVKVWSVQGLDRGCGVEGGDEPQLTLCQVLESHDDFVMQVRYHPGTNGSSSSSSFVSASLDRTLMKWESRGGDDGPMVPVGTFRGHTEGVNCIAFGCSQHSQEVGTAVISGSDDGTIKIWDYEVCLLRASTETVGSLQFQWTFIVLTGCSCIRFAISDARPPSLHRRAQPQRHVADAVASVRNGTARVGLYLRGWHLPRVDRGRVAPRGPMEFGLGPGVVLLRGGSGGFGEGKGRASFPGSGIRPRLRRLHAPVVQSSGDGTRLRRTCLDGTVAGLRH